VSLAPKYAKQMATHQRSREAILGGAKQVVAEVGSYESNMLNIASRAEISRATIYNHFADREEMMIAVVESEINRLIDIALQANSKNEALFKLSREISTDQALAKMVETDHDDIVKLVTISDHPLWITVHRGLADAFGANENNVGLILRWLLAQITSPLSESQSREQASKIASLL
jgi:AcrR family transcriptional regulator